MDPTPEQAAHLHQESEEATRAAKLAAAEVIAKLREAREVLVKTRVEAARVGKTLKQSARHKATGK